MGGHGEHTRLAWCWAARALGDVGPGPLSKYECGLACGVIRAVFIDASGGPTVVPRVAPLRGWRLVTKNSGRLCSERQGGDSQDFRVWVPRVVSLSAVALLLAAVQ